MDEQQVRSLDELRDHEQIRALMAAYCHTMDGRDEKGFRALWTSDAVYDVGGAFSAYVGHDQIAEGAGQIWNAFVDTHHWNANLAVRSTGPGSAVATSNVVAHLVDADDHFVLCSADYADVFVKVDGAWKFQERKITTNCLRQVETVPYG